MSEESTSEGIYHAEPDRASFEQLCGLMAHELQQPIAAAAQYAEACSLHGFDLFNAQAPLTGELLGKCRIQIERAARILQSLRDFYCQRSDKIAIDFEDVVDAALEQLELEDLWDKVSIQYERHSISRIYGNRLLLELVVVNLVKNAMEACQNLPASRRNLSIWIEKLESDRLAFVVKDLGCGMPAGHVTSGTSNHPYASSKVNGMGLGLLLCNSIVQDLGGTVSLSANVGFGTTCSMVLPLHM